MRYFYCAVLVMMAVTSQGLAQLPQWEPDPAIEPRVRALFDQPLRTVHTVLAARPNDSGTRGVVRCYYFQDFIVKELDYGDHGDTAISVTPVAAGSATAKCGKQDDPGEKVLDGGRASYLTGVKGGFIYVNWTMGHNEAPFMIYNAKTANLIYHDAGSNHDPIAISLQNGVLTLKYAHTMEVECSILTAPQECWAKFARDAHLPKPIAKLPPPVAACKAGYLAEYSPNAPSIVSYDVTLTLDHKGQTQVLSRGALSCEAGE